MRQLIADCGSHVLLTRPRRFGKTLMMTTLRSFLELDYAHPGEVPDIRRRIFAGLGVSADEAFCREHLAQYPVVFLSLKNVEGENMDEALGGLRIAVCALYTAFRPVFDRAPADLIGSDEQQDLRCYYRMAHRGENTATMTLLLDALPWLCTLLHRVFARPVYVLIDEYDAPLNAAHARGYGREMTGFIRRMLHPLLKCEASAAPGAVPGGGEAVRQCILSGCLRVGKASIFTGANNVTVLGMEDQRCCTALGFTPREVTAMLDHYQLGRFAGAVEHWYDGYRFGERGEARIYCPWSIASFCAAAPGGGSGTPRNYWVDSSSNDIIGLPPWELPEAGMQQLRTLLGGGEVTIGFREAMAYDELPDGSGDALFSMLYLTGYLTRSAPDPDPQRGLLSVRIPNEEVRECFRITLSRYLGCRGGCLPDSARDGCVSLVAALARGDAAAAGSCLQELLSAHLPLNLAHGGRGGERPEREWIYAMFVHFALRSAAAGRLRALAMERALGDGRADESFVFVQPPGVGCVLEIKLAAGDGEAALEEAARRGLKQIRERRYGEGLLHDPDLGVRRVLAYGIGCRHRRCVVMGAGSDDGHG